MLSSSSILCLRWSLFPRAFVREVWLRHSVTRHLGFDIARSKYRPKNGFTRKSTRFRALELTRELDVSDDIQAQLYLEAMKMRIRELEVELEKNDASNQDTEDLNAKLVRKIEMLKANYHRIASGLERIRQLQLSQQ